MQEISQGIKEEKADLKLTKPIKTLDGVLHFDPLYHKNGKSHKNISLYLKRIEYKEKNIKIG